jgi:hypothetical protein
VTEQLVLDLDVAVRVLLADGLADRHAVPSGGAERLLKALVVHGLDERALMPAAALVIELDHEAVCVP